MKEQEPRTKVLRVNFERQSTPHSCAAKALQLVLNFHNPERFSLGSDLEMSILNRARLGSYEVATHPGLALVALESGFAVDHLVVSPEVFTYPTEPSKYYTMPREEFEEKIEIDREYFRRARRMGLNTHLVDRVTPEILKEWISTKGPLICMTESYGVLHDIVIRGYKGNTFKIVDPLKGYGSLYKDTLIERIHTQYGVSVLAVYPRG